MAQDEPPRHLYGGLKIMALMAAGLVSLAALTTFLGATKRGKEKGRAAVFGKPERFRVEGVREPSGVAFDPRSRHLFVVGDEGSLVELTLAGSVVRSHPVKGNLEDVAVHTPTGDLILLSEQKSELLLYDPSGQMERRRIKLERAALLGIEPGDKNSGFEGLAFREDPRQPGGGIVFLTHQRFPAMIVAVAFDPGRPTGSLGADAVLGRWPVPLYDDLTAITYVPSLDRLLVIAEKKDRLLVMRPEGGLEEEMPLPGQQQEGLCLDGDGDLWVADDEGKALLRFASALETLRAHLRNRGRLGREPPLPAPPVLP